MRLRRREDSNFKYDDRYKRRLKRNRSDESFTINSCNESFKINSCKYCLKGVPKDNQAHNGDIDDDYSAYLSQFGFYNKLRSSVWREDNDGDDNGEDDIDPQYSMFLENLRQNGKSNVLEVANNNGIFESDDECGLQISTKFRNVTKGETIDGAKNTTNISNEEMIESTNISSDDNGEDDIDPQYSMFLENLRQNGKPNVLEVANNNGISESDDECGLQISTKFRNFTEGEMIDGEKNTTNISNEERIESTKDLRDVRSAEKPNPQNILGKLSHGSNGCLNKELKCDTEKNITDQCYQSFLNCKEKEGNDVVFVMNNGQRLKYGDEDGESLSDTEIFVMDDAPDCGEGNFTPFVCSKVYYTPIETEGDEWKCPENTVEKGRSQFREEVMGIYNKPYDQDEFDELMEEVKLQKPIRGHKNLRRRSRSFKADKCSKSYLDHYTDLKAELDRVFFDRPKMLNILRGFFYWLQNLSHEGAFKPWSDPLCRAVKPRVP